MIFTAPWGLLALLGIPAIIAIHMFRRKFPPRPVAGLFLWQTLRQTPEGGGKISKLPITASLILECLAALALALILAGARLTPASVNEHLVVLLDDSASMSAINARNESPRDRAVQRIQEEVERLGRSVRVTLVLSGDRPSVLAGPAALAIEAKPALERWQPQAEHHSLALGLRLARELASKAGRLIVFSDAPPDVRGASAIEGVRWLSMGEPLQNVGITSAQRTLTPSEGRGTISLSLGNFSKDAAKRQLRLVADQDGGKEILAREFDVPAGTSSLNLPIPAGLPAITVSLSNDALSRDNTVTLVEPRPQIVGVQNHLPEGRARDALTRALTSISGATTAENGQLSFGPATVLDQPAEPGVWRVGFGRAPARLLMPGAPQDFIGPFVPEKRHPLLQGVTLGGVVWAGALPVAAKSVHPIVSAGDQPLIAMLGSRPDDGVLFNVDLDRTNLVRAPDWPILVSNLVELRRQNLPGPERWNYRVGEWVRARLAIEPKGPLHFKCGNIERPLPQGRSVEFIAPPSCALLQIMEGKDTLFEVGVNFLDENETNLSDRATAEAGKSDSDTRGMRTETGPESDPLFWTLLVVGGVAMLGNWCWLGPSRSGA
jgi:Ca-activated chloride channel homolog